MGWAFGYVSTAVARGRCEPRKSFCFFCRSNYSLFGENTTGEEKLMIQTEGAVAGDSLARTDNFN